MDREKSREAIAQNEFMTVSGPIWFKGTENAITSAQALQYQKGDLEIIWPPQCATAKPLYPRPPWPKGH